MDAVGRELGPYLALGDFEKCTRKIDSHNVGPGLGEPPRISAVAAREIQHTIARTNREGGDDRSKLWLERPMLTHQ